MRLTGTLRDLYRDMGGRPVVSFVLNQEPQGIEELKDKTLQLQISKKTNKRSLDANALLWACIGDIAAALRTDKWSVYLLMLRRYGKYTYICVPEAAVPLVQRQWRETEVVGDVDINGRKAVQLLCYYGSSVYDTKQFSILLDGVISEMKEMGLNAPDNAEMRRTLEAWERKNEKKGSAES